MKKLLLILVTICAFTSCASVYTEKTFVLNFKDYTDDDFQIIPFDYSGNFEVLGIISNTFVEGRPTTEEDKKKTFKRNVPPMWGINFNYMMKKTIEDAKKLGANGLTRFEITSRQYNNTISTEYTVSGVAVKFKE